MPVLLRFFEASAEQVLREFQLGFAPIIGVTIRKYRCTLGIVNDSKIMRRTTPFYRRVTLGNAGYKTNAKEFVLHSDGGVFMSKTPPYKLKNALEIGRSSSN